LDGGSARLKGATYTNTDEHPCLHWDTIPAFVRAKTFHALNKVLTVTGSKYIRVR
jgi:hypothetical protein